MHTKGKQMGINTYKENTNGHKKDTQKFNTDKTQVRMRCKRIHMDEKWIAKRSKIYEKNRNGDAKITRN